MFASENILEITYLIATALFVLSLKWLSSPVTARRGVWAGEVGMLLAIAGTLLHKGIVDYRWIVIGLVLGTIIGVPLGRVRARLFAPPGSGLSAEETALEAFASFWASAYKEVIVFTLIIPVLLWRSLTSTHVEEEE